MLNAPVKVPTPAPDSSAVSKFEISRLGMVPTISITVVDTEPEMSELTVQSMLPAEDFDEEAPEYVGVLVLDHSLEERVTARELGQAVLLAPAMTTLGVLASVTPLPTEPRTYELRFEDSVAEDISESQLQIRRVNPFGVPSLVPVPNSDAVVLRLAADAPDQFMAMATLMLTAHVKAVMGVLPGLGITDKTMEEVFAAVMAAPENLESLLATEFEALELTRRAGTFIGQTPVA